MSLEVTGGSISEVLPGHGPVLSVARLGHESVLFFSAATWFIGAGSSLRGSFSRPTPISETHTTLILLTLITPAHPDTPHHSTPPHPTISNHTHHEYSPYSDSPPIPTPNIPRRRRVPPYPALLSSSLVSDDVLSVSDAMLEDASVV